MVSTICISYTQIEIIFQFQLLKAFSVMQSAEVSLIKAFTSSIKIELYFMMNKLSKADTKQ